MDEGRSAVLCMGAAHWDMIARAGESLTPGADVPGRVTRQPGGVALNVALALVEHGVPVALLAAIGSDPAGDQLLAEIAARGIDIASVTRVPGPSDLYVAIETRSGEVFAAVADCRALESAGRNLLTPLRRSGPWHGGLLLDGNLPAEVIAELAADPVLLGARLAIVPASPEKAARLAPLIARKGAVLYLNRREAEAIAGTGFADSRAAAESLRTGGVREVLVTDGPRVATHATPEGTFTALPPAVETRGLTGAGDHLVAGHIAARARGLAPEQALREALAAAARHITREMP